MIKFFGKSKSSTITLRLREPDISNRMVSYVKGFNKPEISVTMRQLAGRLKNLNVEYTKDSDPKIRKNMSSLISDFAEASAKLKKDELVTIYVSYSQEFENTINLALNDMQVRKAWLALVENVSVPIMTLRDILGVIPEVVKNASYYSSNLLTDLVIDGVEVEGYEWYSFSRNKDVLEKVSFWISQTLREKMAKALVPADELAGKVSENIPENGNLTVENFSNDLPEDILFLSGLKSSGSLPPQGSSVTAASLKALAKKMDSKDFAMAKGNSMIPTRVSLLEIAYIKYSWASGTTDPLGSSVAKFAKFVMDRLPSLLDGTSFAPFFPKFSGFTKSWAYNSRAKSIVEMVKGLIMPAADGWLSLDNFKMRYLIEDKIVSPRYAYTALFGEESRRVHQLKIRGVDYYTRRNGIDWFTDVTFRFAVSWLRLMCACGIAEIAEDKVAPKDDLMEGIRYIRLTKLGRYAFGIDKKYEGPVQQSMTDMFDVDPSGVITILSSPCPYEHFLKRVGKSIGGNRYVVTAKSLVAASDSEKSVKEDIGRIKTIFKDDPTGYWEKMIDEAEMRCRCGVKIKNSYNLMKLDPSVPGLMDFLVNNAWVRDNCVKAEGSMLLVPAGSFNYLLEILGEEGYIY